MSTTKITIGEITKRLLLLVEEQSGGNVTKFSKKVGVSQATLHNYIKGRTPSAESLYNICNSCGVSLNWLIAGLGPQYIEALQGKTGAAAVVPAGGGSAQTTIIDEDPAVAELLEGARRVLKSGNPIAFDALERNIRYFDHAVASEKRLQAVEAKLEEVMAAVTERKGPKKAANDK
jgi:transcriptional regulator with XRE-family HTH domain